MQAQGVGRGRVHPIDNPSREVFLCKFCGEEKMVIELNAKRIQVLIPSEEDPKKFDSVYLEICKQCYKNKNKDELEPLIF